MDKVDPLFYIHSDRIDLSDETRIKATSEEATKWAETNKNPAGKTTSSLNCIRTDLSLLYSPFTQLYLKHFLSLHSHESLWLPQNYRYAKGINEAC